MSEVNRWTVSITFSEDDDRTRADADLEGASVRLSGYGTARRNPVDPNLPAVGEEIAVARAGREGEQRRTFLRRVLSKRPLSRCGFDNFGLVAGLPTAR